MRPRGSIRYNAPLDDYEREAQDLFAALECRDRDTLWRFKWEHPRFHGKSVNDVEASALGVEDARIVIAREHAFDRWDDLRAFTAAVERESSVRRFEAAVDAVIGGDLDALDAMLREHPELVTARSSRRHHATLLHYLGANGVEHGRQKTSANAIEIARALLEAGAEVDALADTYGARCTTMSLLVSSSPPAEAGLQAPLAEALLDHGAALEGPGTQWSSAVMTALVFGFPDTAETLARRGGPIRSFPIAAGLGRLADVERLLPTADGPSRHAGLALAAQLGRTEVVKRLLDAGEDPDRYNPDGIHSHATPLHHAVWSGRESVVRLLIERGARLDLRDRLYGGTPLGWALHGQRTEMARLLREHGAPE